MPLVDVKWHALLRCLAPDLLENDQPAWIAVLQGFEDDAVDDREHRRRRSNRQRQRDHHNCRVEAIAAKTAKRVAQVEEECAHSRLDVAYLSLVGRQRLIE